MGRKNSTLQNIIAGALLVLQPAAPIAASPPNGKVSSCGQVKGLFER
jgi:hypothetical protein